MTIYAHVVGDVVAELFTPPDGFSIEECFHSSVNWIDCTATPSVAPGWTATETAGTWAFAPPPAPPASTLAQRAATAVAAGLTITITGGMTLAATLFPTDAATQAKLGAVAIVINTTGGFPDGAPTYPLKDAAGGWHALTVAQYKIVAGAVASYVAALDLIADGNPLGASALPSPSITLAL